MSSSSSISLPAFLTNHLAELAFFFFKTLLLLTHSSYSQFYRKFFVSVFLFFIFKKFNSLQIYLILNSLLRLQCCAILVAIIYINTHCSVLFYYLIFISLLTQLLPTFSTQPLCFPTIHAITCLFSCNYTSLSLFSSSHNRKAEKHHFESNRFLHQLSTKLTWSAWGDREHIQNISRAFSVSVHSQQRDKFSFNTN